MKFRYKVILLNLVLLSLTTGIVGFILMQRSYDLTMNTEIKSAVTENNLVQSSVEYSLLEVVNSGNYDLGRSLPEIGQEVYSGMLSGNAVFAIDGLCGVSDDASIPYMSNAHADQAVQQGRREIGKLTTAVLGNGAVFLACRVPIAV